MIRSALVQTICCLVVAAQFSARSLAQDKPAGLLKRDAATTGKTDVAQEGFQQAAVKAPDINDETKLEIMAGGMLAAGNSESLAATGAGKFLLRRGDDQLTAALAGNYAVSEPISDDPDVDDLDWEPTVENVQGNVRYDRFLTDRLSLFISVSGRYDRFQGLDLRLNVDPGVAYYFIQEQNQKFWGEIGYDLQVDIRRQETIDEAAAADPPEDIDKSEVRHHGRLFLGYDNKINKAIAFFAGLEYLQGIPKTENWRLNGDLGLTSSIGEDFSIATTISLKYDHNPLPSIDHLDITTAINLIYTLI